MGQAQVDEMRKRNQRTADADHGRMPRGGVIGSRQNSDNEKQDARNQKQEGRIVAMPAQPEQQTDRGEHDGEADEYLFKGMAGEKAETERRQDSENQRQQGAMNGAEHRGERTKAIQFALQRPVRNGINRTIIHGSGKDWLHRVGQHGKSFETDCYLIT